MSQEVEVFTGMATAEAVPSPAEIIIGGCGHAGDVSVAVNVTKSGAIPAGGATSRMAVVVAFEYPALTVTVTVWRTSSVVALVRVTGYVPASQYVYVNTCGVRPAQGLFAGIAVAGGVPSPAEIIMAE